jgi:hypothetical protein
MSGEKEHTGDVRVEHPRCPFCHEAVRPEEEKAACLHCMAWQHGECWRELGERCGSCRRSRYETAPATPTRIQEAQGGTSILIRLVVAVSLLFVGCLASAAASAMIGPLAGGLVIIASVVFVGYMLGRMP